MSAYQYYEFLAIDRPLTEDEQRAVAGLSSRVDMHPRRAVFVYNWSDFPGRAEEILARYYDAMLYLTNWGSRRLMFRFPADLVDVEQLQQYGGAAADYPQSAVNVRAGDEHVILDVYLDDEEASTWLEGEGWLDALVGLREAILRQDYRLLYLAWLEGVAREYDADEEALEPPLPAGLQTLSPALRTFVELFDLDTSLIQAAAEQSEEVAELVPDDELLQAIGALEADERDGFLLRLAKGEPHVSLALNRRLRTLTGVPLPPGGATARRTVGELLAAAKVLRERRHREQVARAEARRTAELEALAEREGDVWREVDALIEQTKGKAYDEAVQLLLRLRDLARRQEREAAFDERVCQIRARYSRRPALMDRLRRAELMPSAGE